jgi:3-methyl-2-oxobutanoate hydroxymethyltransferase
MPFMTYQLAPQEAIRNAGRLIQEGGAAAVKIEGGQHIAETAKRMVDIGIPVMGHLGLTPQSVHKLGGFRQQARSPEAALELVQQAILLERSGVFSIVLESIPPEVAREVTESVDIPTIGIGAGPHCDGQVLVSHDALGLFDKPAPSFVKQYCHLADDIVAGARTYIEDVRAGRFP